MSTTFLGLPVNGDIIDNYPRPNQRPLEEFTPIIQAVIDDPTIVEFGWSQYTPHFNDGDACEFGVHEPIWFRTQDDEDADDHWDLALSRHERHPSLGHKGDVWDAVQRTYVDKPYEGPDEARYDRCMALQKALDSGEFLDVLLEAFGDHADVSISKSGIDLEYCHHD